MSDEVRQSSLAKRTDTPSVTLRAVEPEDVDRLYLWENDPEMWPCGTCHAPYSRHQLWEYANSTDFNPLASGQLRMIIEAEESDGTKTACGTVDLYDVDVRNGRAFVGIMLARAFRGKGIAGEALEYICKYAREALGLRMLAAEISADNEASLRLFRRARFEQTGGRPQWYRRPNGYIAALEFMRKL